MSMKIVVLDGYTLNPGDLSWRGFQELGDVTIYDRTSSEELLERCKGAEALITNKTVLSADTMDKLPDLKYIGVLATGYNVVDIDAARKKGIVVTNIPAYSTNSVVQMVFAHILNITNRVAYYANQDREGLWSRNKDFCYWDFPMSELKDKKIGLIGLGHIGMATAKVAIAFGMQVYAFTSKNKSQLPAEINKLELDDLFKECDIISLHCPLTESTKHLVNEERLSLMKSNAIIINTGRGPLIDEHALTNALNDGTIAAAGLDVLSHEPPSADNPLLCAKNCYITPHIAWATIEARTRLMQIAVDNLKGFIEGKVINNVAK